MDVSSDLTIVNVLCNEAKSQASKVPSKVQFIQCYTWSCTYFVPFCLGAGLLPGFFLLLPTEMADFLESFLGVDDGALTLP